MIVVIQCAGSKNPDAGYFRTREGLRVSFVGNPDAVPPNAGTGEVLYARPDDDSDTEGSWRDRLRAYNADPGSNPLGLVPAWSLYKNPTYKRLADHCGADRLYILSAGWGLVRSDFLTPNYDITFSAGKSVKKYQRRYKNERFEDFRMLPNEISDSIVFFGSKSYVDLFCKLTSGVKGTRTVWYNSDRPPIAPGCRLFRFHTATRTNWQYEAAKALVHGTLSFA